MWAVPCLGLSPSLSTGQPSLLESDALRDDPSYLALSRPASKWSGMKESNLRSAYPKGMDYHYPNPRNLVALGGIGPPFSAYETDVLAIEL